MVSSILVRFNYLNSFIWQTDVALTDSIIPGESKPGNNVV